MPTTSYNITMIKSACGAFSRAQILEVLNEVQMIVFNENTMRVEKIDTATGMPPYLATVQGTRHYSCPADCRETGAIFVLNPHTGYQPTQDKGGYAEYIWRTNRYYKVAAHQQSATIGQLATVTFVDDPGTTTDKYYHNYFIKHTNLTAETQQLIIPEEVHYILRDGVIQMLKGELYSSGMGKIGPIEQIAHRIRNKLNKGTHARPGRTPIRDVDRDDDFNGLYY